MEPDFFCGFFRFAVRVLDPLAAVRLGARRSETGSSSKRGSIRPSGDEEERLAMKFPWVKGLAFQYKPLRLVDPARSTLTSRKGHR